MDMRSWVQPSMSDTIKNIEENLPNQVKEDFEGSTMSKAGKLAMELNKERKRLKQEMEELQLEVEDLKPATPTGTIDSYVKWLATILGVVGVFIMSAGFGTAGSSIGTGISERNFLGKGIDLDTNLEISDDSVKGMFVYSRPNFAYTDNTLFTSFQSTTSDFLKSSGYKLSKTGFSIGTKIEQYENFFFSPEIDLSFEDLETNSTASSSLKKQQGAYDDLYFNYSIDYDLRNSQFRPSSGNKISFFQELPLASKSNEISNIFTFSQYKTLNNSSNMIGRASLYLKTVNSIEGSDVRISKRAKVPYNRLRGFKQGKVGPIDNNDYIGGNYVSTLNLSTNLPGILTTFENIEFSYFLDVANIWGVDYDDDIDDSNFIRSSTGLGVDFLTPIGPLSFSLSEPITKKSTDITESFRFNLGTTF